MGDEEKTYSFSFVCTLARQPQDIQSDGAKQKLQEKATWLWNAVCHKRIGLRVRWEKGDVC
jgi:hypothetical protein